MCSQLHDGELAATPLRNIKRDIIKERKHMLYINITCYCDRDNDEVYVDDILINYCKHRIIYVVYLIFGWRSFEHWRIVWEIPVCIILSKVDSCVNNARCEDHACQENNKFINWSKPTILKRKSLTKVNILKLKEMLNIANCKFVFDHFK